MLPDTDVLLLIPQRPPFVMISGLLATDERITRTCLYIDVNNVLVDDGYFTEAGLIENVAQTAAARAGCQARAENRAVDAGYISAVKNLRVFGLPQAGQELITEIEVQDQVFTTTLIIGRVWCSGQLVMSCEMSIFIGKPQG